jgi:hypothetical protein
MRPKVALVWTGLLLTSCGYQRTYAEGCGPSPKGWITPRQGRGVLSVLSVISVQSDGAVLWNDKPISEERLRSYLKLTSELNPVPVTQIKFSSSTDCDTVRRLRNLMASNLDCSYGKCAEGTGKWWFVGDVIGNGPSEPYDPDTPSGSDRKQ